MSCRPHRLTPIIDGSLVSYPRLSLMTPATIPFDFHPIPPQSRNSPSRNPVTESESQAQERSVRRGLRYRGGDFDKSAGEEIFLTEFIPRVLKLTVSLYCLARTKRFGDARRQVNFFDLVFVFVHI